MKFILPFILVSFEVLSVVFGKPIKGKHNGKNAFEEIEFVNTHTKEQIGSEKELFEEDINFENDSEIERLAHHKMTSPERQRRDVITGPYAWPNGKAPYVFANDYPWYSKYLVRSSMDEIQKVSCVQFVERTNEKDYIKIFDDKLCYSSIGKRGSNQTLSLGDNCLSDSIIQHELFHALGFFHEQSRLERDSFVTVHWDNIIKGKEHNFQKYKIGEAHHLNEAYDEKSIMHYSNYIFAIDKNKMTISSKANPTKFLGGFQMTDTDVRQLNKFYNCPCADHMFGCEFITSMCGLLRTQQYCQKSCGFCRNSPNPPTRPLPTTLTITTMPTTTTNTPMITTTTSTTRTTTTTKTTTTSTTTTTTTPTTTTTTPTTTTTTRTTTPFTTTRTTPTATTLTTPITPTTLPTTTTTIPTTTTTTPTTLMTPKRSCFDALKCCPELAAHGLCKISKYIQDACENSCHEECILKTTKTSTILKTTTITTPKTATTTPSTITTTPSIITTTPTTTTTTPITTTTTPTTTTTTPTTTTTNPFITTIIPTTTTTTPTTTTTTPTIITATPTTTTTTPTTTTTTPTIITATPTTTTTTPTTTTTTPTTTTTTPTIITATPTTTTTTPTTTTTTPTTTTKASCVNKHPKCWLWSYVNTVCFQWQGCCHNSQYGAWMRENCAWACGLCSPFIIG
uniref:Metalloendopeptidase n=1 Tax=Clytia hemisphaerica TaxID=252671 RepID=A0A7M5U6M1_9CNID